MAEEQKQISESEKKKEDWMNSKWRPAMGWMYMLTCMTDFILFPILWSLLQTVTKQPITQWQPLTLQGAGYSTLPWVLCWVLRPWVVHKKN
jgi:hypothetical protein